jgi:hypothetical protein
MPAEWLGFAAALLPEFSLHPGAMSLNSQMLWKRPGQGDRRGDGCKPAKPAAATGYIFFFFARACASAWA